MFSKIMSIFNKKEAVDPFDPLSNEVILPSQEFIEGMTKHPYTPDILHLEMHEFHLVFIPDECKVDHHRYDVIEDSAPISVGFTKNDFEFYKYFADDEAFDTKNFRCVPLLANRGYSFLDKVPATKIHGEIVAVPYNTLVKLDEYKQNGVQFKRVRALVTLPFRKVVWIKDRQLCPYPLVQFRQNGDPFFGRSIATTFERTTDIRVWMYIGVKEHWEPLINAYNFEPVSTFRAKRKLWLGSYYNLIKNE